jgi:hypothetical protein
MRRPRQERPRGRGIDRALDSLLPPELRHLSLTHWTPADVAVRVVSLLSPRPTERILDIGAGVGKVCTIGALSMCGTWCGVEQYEPLVAVARGLATALGVADRTQFLHADAFALDWNAYDAFYLYNPFVVPMFDEDPATRDVLCRAQVTDVERRLAGLAPGKRVVTLHGFGGVMPSSYELVYQEHVPLVGHDLVLWQQRAS